MQGNKEENIEIFEYPFMNSVHLRAIKKIENIIALMLWDRGYYSPGARECAGHPRTV